MVMFNGYDLERIAACVNPEFSVFSFSPNTVNIPGRRGQAVNGVESGSAEVSFEVVIKGSSMERRVKLSTLAAWLDVDEPKALVLPDAPDWEYMAVPDGELEIERGQFYDSGKLTFKITNPVAYGREVSVTVPSGGSVDVHIGGNFPTRPKITANAKRNSSTLVWGLRLDEGDYVHVTTGSSSARAVVLDCDARTLTVAGAAAIPTIDSDWIELAPGQHTLRMDNGTGAATVTWRERW